MNEQRRQPPAPTPAPEPGWVPLRGASGTLYGFIDPARRIVEFKRNGRAPERIDLDTYLDIVAKPR